MSRTYEIVCHDCRVRLWVGQGWPPDRLHLYFSPRHQDLLERFLFGHMRHKIEFGDDEQLDVGDDYEPLHDE